MNRAFRRKGLHRIGLTDRQRAIARLDAAFGKMIRERDAGKRCISCPEVHPVIDAGHFRRRELMSTRFDYRNVNGQGVKENRFEGGRTYEQGLEIDRRWGRGTAKELLRKSATIKQWDGCDLGLLTDAARKGFMVYKQVYDDLISTKP